MERACLLCRRADTDPELCGLMLEAQGLCAHQYCLFFANGLFHHRPSNNGLMGFLPEDVLHIVERAAQKNCFVCSESGATITCQETGCNRSFHFPCASEGGCVTQFLPHYRSYCWEHRPQQERQEAPENTACLICLEPVEDSTSYGTMVCPACQHAWFHRGCIQGQAMGAGMYCFQCPLCRDKDRFVSLMLILGIRVPLRMPLWENNNAYAGLGDRHSRCDARECLCPQGREHREGRGPWQLFLCSSCAAEGTHRGCFGLRTSGALWECDSCAGLGTASSDSSELAGPSTASQAASGPSLGSPAPEISSPSTASQAGSGPSHSSLVLETSSPSTGSQEAWEPSSGSPALETSSHSLDSLAASEPSDGSLGPDTSSPTVDSQVALGQSLGSLEPNTSSPSTASPVALGPSHSSPVQETSSPSTTSQEASEPSHSSPVQEGSCSSHPGPDRMRNRSRLQRRAQNPYNRPRRHNERSGTPAPSTESITQGQDVLGPSHLSPIPESSSPSPASLEALGPSHSSLAEETSSPRTTSQEASGPSYSSLAEETSSPSTTSQLPLGSSSTSPELESNRCSSPPGPVRARGRSRLQRRAQNPYSRPRRRRGTSRGPSPRAESSTPSHEVQGPSVSRLPETSSSSTASQEPSGSSSGTPELDSGGGFSPPGPVRTRGRSRLQRRAQNPYSRPRQRHGTSGARSRSAGRDPPAPAQ